MASLIMIQSVSYIELINSDFESNYLIEQEYSEDRA